MDWLLENGDVLGRGPGTLALSNGVITADASAGRRFDASGLILAPGLCDVHGDGFERNIAPRPGVTFPIDTALLATDRELAANGITTAYLALTISWEPGLRSVANARAVIEALDRLRPQLSTDLRIQLRWEVFALDAAPVIEEWLKIRPRPVLAFNDHLSGLLRKDGDRLEKNLDSVAKRAGLSVADYHDLVERTGARAGEVPGAIERLAKAAHDAGVVCFAHDEVDAATRSANRAIGIDVSEFPLSAEAAMAATQQGEETILGAPNVLRGGSHIGCLDAAPAIADGMCTVLASDYYYPSLLQSAVRLDADGVLPLDRAWPLISANPARACGLTDRGTLAPGQRGDVIALQRSDAGLTVQAVFRAGTPVLVRDAARIT